MLLRSSIAIFILLGVLFLGATGISSLSNDIIMLDDETFEHDTQSATGSTTGDWFVAFTADFCGHCQALLPLWKELADKRPLHGVNIARVDCGYGWECARFNIRSYPTVYLLHDGRMYNYEGQRTVDGFISWLKQPHPSEEGIPVPPPMTAVDKSIWYGKFLIEDMYHFYLLHPYIVYAYFAFLALVIAVSAYVGTRIPGPTGKKKPTAPTTEQKKEQ